MGVPGQRLGKHVSAAMVTHATGQKRDVVNAGRTGNYKEEKWGNQFS
jgi:hypothetical protein